MISQVCLGPSTLSGCFTVAQNDAYMQLRENVKLSGGLESLEYVRYLPAGDRPYIDHAGN